MASRDTDNVQVTVVYNHCIYVHMVLECQNEKQVLVDVDSYTIFGHLLSIILVLQQKE